MERQDIYKVAISVVMIHLVLIFVFEGFLVNGNDVSDTIILSQLSSAIDDAGAVSDQISDVGLCLEGTATQQECEANGCTWDSGQCFNAIEDRTGVDFGFFDVILSIIKIPLYLGKFLLFLGSVVFFDLILSFKLMPLMTNVVLRFLVSVILWAFGILKIYLIWAFISNWRGQR